MPTLPHRFLAVVVASMLVLAYGASPTLAARTRGGSLQTTTTITVTPTVAFGRQSIRATATVRPYGGVGHAWIIVDGERGPDLPLDASGTASYNVGLAPGTHTLQVRYGGHRDWLPSESDVVEVDQRPYRSTRVSALLPNVPLVSGVLASLGGGTPWRGPHLYGRVSGRPGAAPVSQTTGRFRVDPQQLMAGKSRFVTWLDDRSARTLETASCPIIYTVARRTLRPRLSVAAKTVDTGSAVQLEYIAGRASDVPIAAQVEYRIDGQPLAGRSAAPLADGRHRETIRDLDPGTYRITAHLSPSEQYKAPVVSVTVTVVRGRAPALPAAKPGAAPTTTALTVHPDAATWGSEAPLTVAVDPPTRGRVKIYSGAREIRDVEIDAQGRATAAMREVAPGSHPLVAIFQGTKASAPSRSATQTVQVAWQATSVELELSRATIGLGESLRATATISPVPDRGRLSIGGREVDVDPETGVGELVLDDLESGTWPIVATYHGRSPWGPSTSATRTVTVGRLPSTTRVLVTTNGPADEPLPDGGALVNVIVEPEHLAEQQNGPIDLYLDGVRVMNARTNGTARLDLNVGSYELTARYRGNRSLEPSTSELVSFQVGDREARPRPLTGTAVLRGPSRTRKPVVLLDITPDPESGPIRAFQVSNDGVRWATWLFDDELYTPATKVPWSLTEVACGGRAGDGPRTIRVRFLSHLHEDDRQNNVPVARGGPLRSDVITIPVVLDR